MVLFGRDRERLFPDAWIQAGRFEGTTRTDILDSQEIHEYPPLAIEEATGFVRKHAMHSFRIEGIRRDERWSIPLKAVREAVVNAVAHADYSQRGAPVRLLLFDDRLEVEKVNRQILNALRSSGGLATKQVAQSVGLSARSARTRLKGLVAKRLVTEVGSSLTDPKRLYFVTEEAPR